MNRRSFLGLLGVACAAPAAVAAARQAPPAKPPTDHVGLACADDEPLPTATTCTVSLDQWKSAKFTILDKEFVWTDAEMVAGPTTYTTSLNWNDRCIGGMHDD